MKQLIKFKNCNTIQGIKGLLKNLKNNEIMQIKRNGSWALSNVISYYAYDTETQIFKIEVPLGLLRLMHEYTKIGFTPTNVTKYGYQFYV